MVVGPEDPRPFAEIVGRLNAHITPWRMSMLVEGGGRNMMAFKKAAATILGFVPSNRQIYQAFLGLKRIRDDNMTSWSSPHQFRDLGATWRDAPSAPAGRHARAAGRGLGQLPRGDDCRRSAGRGDEQRTRPGVASTAPPAAAPLGEVLRMLPWGRPASPWRPRRRSCSARPMGRIWPFDPAGSRRTMFVDLFVAPSGYGKSVLDNTILLGLCLSKAAQGANGTKLPFIGKLDIGPSAEGFIQLLQEALPEHFGAGEAIYAAMQLADGYEVNVFDTQLGCRDPLPLEKAFLQNFLSLGTMPIDSDMPFEGMDQMIGFVIDEAYRLFADTSTGNKRPKRYLPGVAPEVDAALDPPPHPHGGGRLVVGSRRRVMRAAGVASRRGRPTARRAAAART